MPLNISRLILYVRNVESLKEFYCKYFGLHTVEEIKDEWVLLSAGQIELALHRVGESYRGNDDGSPRTQSNSKIVFQVHDNIKVLSESFKRKGVAMSDLKSYKGFPYLLCDGKDPEGNVFQLMQRADFI